MDDSLKLRLGMITARTTWTAWKSTSAALISENPMHRPSCIQSCSVKQICLDKFKLNRASLMRFLGKNQLQSITEQIIWSFQAARVGDVGGDGDLLVLLKALRVRVLSEEKADYN